MHSHDEFQLHINKLVAKRKSLSVSFKKVEMQDYISVASFQKFIGNPVRLIEICVYIGK